MADTSERPEVKLEKDVLEWSEAVYDEWERELGDSREMKLTARLIDAGYDDLEKMAGATLEQLTAIEGIGEKTAEKIKDVAARLMAGEEVQDDGEDA